MTAAQAADFLHALALANPAPETELRYRDPFTLLVAVALSAQTTDVAVNRATATLFEAISRPSRSLSARGLRLLVIGLALATALPAALMLALGAWPVLGFLGIELGLVILLLTLHRRRSGVAQEVICLTEERLTVRVADGSGRLRVAELEPYWTRVALEEAPDGDARLALVQRHRRVELGCFLSADEKRSLGSALAGALRRYRSPDFDNPQLH